MKSLCKTLGLMSALFLALLIFAEEKGDAAKGKELFNNRCVNCHGSSGEGKEAIAKAFNARMRPLSSKEVQAQDDAALKKIILEGKEKMRANALSEVEANDVIAFLRSLKK